MTNLLEQDLPRSLHQQRVQSTYTEKELAVFLAWKEFLNTPLPTEHQKETAPRTAFLRPSLRQSRASSLLPRLE